MPLLSMRQYAKQRGCSPEAVSKAVRTGRISTVTDEKGQRKIDPEIADREWAANSEGVRPNYGIPSSEARVNQAQADPTAPKKPTVQDSAAVLKAYQARLAKLEFDEKSGKLHDISECSKNAFKSARATRDAMLGIPDRLSAELAGETDQVKIRRRLDTEIRQALDNLASVIEGHTE